MARAKKDDLLKADKPKLPPREYFTKLQQARQALRERVDLYRAMLEENILLAQADGEYEVASSDLKWLISHAPADEDGVKLIDQDIDKPKVDSSGKRSGPTINFGFALGGISASQKTLPEGTVIDIIEEPDDPSGT